MLKVDLNSDLGESFGAYKLGMDAEIIKLISSANIACGWHGGDPMVMENTVKLCKAANTAVGAHPGYPDLLGFGRRQMNMSFDEAKTAVKYQLGALMAFAKSYGLKVEHLKPHGAMGNTSGIDETLARAICEAVYEVDKDIIMLNFPNLAIAKVAKEMGMRFANEVFADRAYNEDWTLVARGTPGAMVTDPDVATKRVIRMIKEGKVTAITGKDIDIKADSVCVHGDTPTALTIVNNLRTAIEKEGIQIVRISEFIS